jgi:hypothetical protein
MSHLIRPSRPAGLLAVLVGVLALSACGLPGVNATPDAGTILQNVQKIQLKDAAFSFSFTGMVSSSVPAAPTGTITGVGSGKITTSPQRADVTFSLPIAGQQIPLEVLYDGSTKSVYATSSLLSVVSQQSWLKISLAQFGSFDLSPFLNFTQLLNVSLAGTETLNGASVYHLTGSDSPSGTSATLDLYVRTDNYNPVRAVIKLNSVIIGTATLDFTGINTGLAIDLPAPGDVVGG